MRSHAKATTAGSTMRRANGRLLLIAAVAAALLLVPAAAAPGAVLTVTLGGGGTGSVTGGTPANPKAINCSNTPGNEQTACSFDFGFFETVTLSRQATAGSIFTGWSGNSEAGSCQSGSAGSCSYFSFFSPVNVTASFAPPPDPPIETTILKIEEPLSGTARLKGLTNPNSALAPLTECRFEYGETTAYGQSAPCEQDPVGPATSWVALSTSVSRLKPSTTYHFRLFTANSGGADHSADVTLTTGPAPGGCPNEAIRAQQGATYLPNCRAFELVTPVDKGPAGAMVEGLGSRQLGPRASEDGDSIIWPLQNGMPGTTAGGWLRMKATRAADGWLSEQVSAPSLIPPPEVEESFAQPSQLLYGSPDLGCALVQSFQPLTEDIPSPEAGVLNLFRWNGADGSYTLISNRFPLDPRAPSSSPVGISRSKLRMTAAASTSSPITSSSRKAAVSTSGTTGCCRTQVSSPTARSANPCPRM